ncbi:MAG: hypothetical protein V2A63_02085 [Patescibacteria group bacterium]
MLEKSNPPAEFELTLNELVTPHGENIIAVLGYGSNFGGYSKNTQDSIWDAIVVVDDLKGFHAKNIAERPRDYWKFLRSAKVQSWLNRRGMNYIQSEGKDGTKFKYGVIGLSELEADCADSRFADYAAGRLQKNVSLLNATADPEKFARLDAAISRARVRGALEAILTLGPGEFSLNDFLPALVRLSYISDVRLEDKNKIQKIVDQTREKLLAIYEPLLAELIAKSAWLKKTDHGFYSELPECERDEEICDRKRMRPRTAFYNFAKNLLSNTRSLPYAFAKVQKWWRSRSQPRSSGE